MPSERYFNSVLLVFTGYKPKSHDIEALAKQTSPLHEAMQGALPRTEPTDKHHFGLLKRAYIDARYSKSYRVTPEDLSILRDSVLDLAKRVRTACADKLHALSPNGEIPALAGVPAISDSVELPELPDLSDPNSVAVWRDAIAQVNYDRGSRNGMERGRDEGLQEGLERGRQAERARAIVDVLRRRGIALSEEEAQRMTECRDDATLSRWWERAWTVTSVEEL